MGYEDGLGAFAWRDWELLTDGHDGRSRDEGIQTEERGVDEGINNKEDQSANARRGAFRI